ncbi:MAG: GDP-mannose 4,6-dehydratase [Ectobacillus sp.]
MKIFVTGANGFVGKHLVAELSQRGHEVFAGIRPGAWTVPSPVKACHYDILNRKALYELLKKIKPDGIIHLASQSKVAESWKDPAATFSVNAIGTIHLIQAAAQSVPQAKIITAGSSEEYGLAGKSVQPLTEEDACYPQNPYAASKLAMGQVALQLARKHDLNLIHVRAFNHFGPGQREGFVISDFASQIARIENKGAPAFIRVGDLRIARDFTDVRDVVRAYSLLLEKEVNPGVYNICSGAARTLHDILEDLLRMADVLIQIQIDKERFRPAEVLTFLGSPRKINEAIQWKPEIPFHKSLLDTLQFWRMQIRQGN